MTDPKLLAEKLWIEQVESFLSAALDEAKIIQSAVDLKVKLHELKEARAAGFKEGFEHYNPEVKKKIIQAAYDDAAKIAESCPCRFHADLPERIRRRKEELLP